MNPRCLKETISPGCGFHLFANSVVPAGATNRIPFGLYIYMCGNDMEIVVRITAWAAFERFAITYSSHSHVPEVSALIIFASASRYF